LIANGFNPLLTKNPPARGQINQLSIKKVRTIAPDKGLKPLAPADKQTRGLSPLPQQTNRQGA